MQLLDLQQSAPDAGPELWFGEVAQQKLRLEDSTQIPVGAVETILGRASNQAFQCHGRGRVAGDERAVELAHALPLFLNDPYIYCAIGSRHQVRQDAVVTIAVNPVEPLVLDTTDAKAMVVTCRLMKDGAVLEETQIPLAANGQEARYIEEMFTFTGADVSDFVGSVRCTVPAEGEGMFTGVAVELDAANRIFTTLPVVPVPERMSQE